MPKNTQNEYLYNLIGVDLDNKTGNERIKKINLGLFPFDIKDNKLKKSLKIAHKQKRSYLLHIILNVFLRPIL